MQEGFDVFGESDIVVEFIVRRLAVVARVNRVDGALERASEDTVE